MDRVKSRQPANRNCCRAFHELCSNYLSDRHCTIPSDEISWV